MMRPVYLSLLLTVCLVWPSDVWAVRVRGEGPTHSFALNNAFQQAVEMVIGTAIDSQTMVESGKMVRDEIISHSKGYVSKYEIVQQGHHSDDGGYFVELDAEVNEGLVQDHIESLEILMKMTGHPKALILGIDDDFESITTASGGFSLLTDAVIEVFRNKFRFDILDWDTIRKKHLIDNKPSRENFSKYARQAGANFVVLVKVNALLNSGNLQGKLSLEAIRSSDAHFLGKETRDLKKNVSGEHHNLNSIAIQAAKDEVFFVSVQLAKNIVEDLQRETERGKGFRYSIVFIDFPPGVATELVETHLAELSGYVRRNIEKTSNKNMELSYWSNLRGENLFSQIVKILEKQGFKYKSKLDGRSLKFKWMHPDFE